VIVVDASVAVKWFVAEEGHINALRLLEQDQVLIAPDLIFSEVGNVFWKKMRRGEATLEQSERACRALPEFLGAVAASASLIVPALHLADRLGHPIYDCIYLACAQEQGAKLVTADKRFMNRIIGADLHYLAIALEGVSTALSQSRSENRPSISDAELTRVLNLSDRYRRTVDFVGDRVARPIGGGTIKWINSAELAPAFDSPSRRNLRRALSELSGENLRDLVALAWLGRGFDGRDWGSLRKSAEDMLGNTPLEHEGYITSLLSYVEEGLQALSELRG
jgi:predicted nucleic acid-binding protein